MQFRQSQGVPKLYWAVDTGASPTASTSPVAGFLLPESYSASLPAQIDFPTSWQTLYGSSYGCYIFLDQPVAQGQEQALAANVWAFLAANATSGQFWRLLWFSDPASASPAVGIELQPPPPNGSSWTLKNQTDFRFAANYEITFAPGTLAFPATDGSATVDFQQPGGSFSFIYLTANGTQLQEVTSFVSVPFTGAAMGALSFSMQLQNADFDTLDFGLRYYYSAASGNIASLRYPVFMPAGIQFSLTIDPLAPTDSGRTFWAFPPSTTLLSYFGNDMGSQTYTLSPLPDAKMVFAPQAAGPANSLTIVPAGDFSVSPGATNLLCGLSGVEYVKIPAQGSVTMRFVPGQPAFAPSFSPSGGSPTGSTILLNSQATTSWIYLFNAQGGNLSYSAQPETSILYQPQGGSSQGAVPPPLWYMEVVASELPQPGAGAGFPMVPYGGVAVTDINTAQQLELQVLSPARRTQILAAGQAPQRSMASAGGSTGVTPQGLLAEFSGSQVTVTLAQNQDSTVVQLAAIESGSPLWNALQTTQMFLVISDPSTLTGHLTPSQFRMQDPTGVWTFDVNPANWNDTGASSTTLLLMKFYSGKALLDAGGQTGLATTPGLWTQGDAFNHGNSASISQALTEFLTDAVQRAATNPDFAPFVNNVVQNPAWNGILALNIPNPGVPEGLGGILAGIPAGSLAAHHVGLNFSPIQSDGVTPSIQASSLFGLIDYEDTALPPAAAAGYQFKMLSLNVLFLNSAVARFSSQAALQMNELFGEPAALASTNNCIVLNGVYQSSGANPAYVFTTSAASSFAMTSGVLNNVVISQAQFISATQAGASGTTVSNFALWGWLDFQAIPSLDVFSFGSGTGSSGQGLSFSNVSITMTASQPQNGLPGSTQFDFSAGKLAFDLDQSSFRNPSLYQQFPLKLTAFLETLSSTSPSDLGYMPVTSQAGGGLLKAPWYGLQFDLELGSLGAWAATKGFVATFLAAWSPTGTAKGNVFLGLQLPGSSGSKKELTIEGPLKLSIQNIQLGSQTTNGQTAYLMWLQSIALSFFSVTLPPSGRTDFVLFGGPSATPGQNTIGWYASYSKTSSTSSGSGTKAPQLVEGGK
jgi:hypothetical protein